MDVWLEKEQGRFQTSTRQDHIWQRYCPHPIHEDAVLRTLDEYLSDPETQRALEAYDANETYPASVVDNVQCLGLSRLFCDVASITPKATSYHLSALNLLTARSSASLAITVGVNSLALLSAYRGASHQQLTKILARVRNGAFCALALTELEHGSDLLQIESRATAGRLSERGAFVAVSDTEKATHYLLQSKKDLINGGSEHDLVFILLRNHLRQGSDKTDHHNREGHSLFWIERHQPVEGAIRWRTLPAPAADISAVRLEDVVIDAEHRIGEHGAGIAVIRDTLAMSRAGVAALAVGTLARARELVIAYAANRTIHGHPIGQFGAIAAHVTRMDAIERAATAASLRAVAWVNACGARAAPYTAIAKLMSCRLAEEGISEGRHVLGARALLKQLPYARILSDIPLFGVFDGTSHLMLDEIQMYLSMETRRSASNKAEQEDTVALMRKVYAIPPRSLVEVSRAEPMAHPVPMVGHAVKVSRIPGATSVQPVAALAEAVLLATAEAKRLNKWGKDQELRFCLAEIYALVEVMLGLIELFDPVRRSSFTENQPVVGRPDELGYRHALAWLGSRACSKLSRCIGEAGLHPANTISSPVGEIAAIANIQNQFLEGYDDIRQALAKALFEEYRSLY